MTFLSVILVPAGNFPHFCFFPLRFLGGRVCLRGLGSLAGLIGIFLLLCHDILPLRWMGVGTQEPVTTTYSSRHFRKKFPSTTDQHQIDSGEKQINTNPMMSLLDLPELT